MGKWQPQLYAQYYDRLYYTKFEYIASDVSAAAIVMMMMIFQVIIDHTNI